MARLPAFTPSPCPSPRWGEGTRFGGSRPVVEEDDAAPSPERHGAHVRAREEAVRGDGAPLATSRGVGQRPT